MRWAPLVVSLPPGHWVFIGRFLDLPWCWYRAPATRHEPQSICETPRHTYLFIMIRYRRRRSRDGGGGQQQKKKRNETAAVVFIRVSSSFFRT